MRVVDDLGRDGIMCPVTTAPVPRPAAVGAVMPSAPLPEGLSSHPFCEGAKKGDHPL